MLADLWACSMPTCDLDYRTSDVIPRGCCVPARKLRESDTLLLSAVMGRRSSEEYATATGVLAGHSGALRRQAEDLMIPGAARARLWPRESGLDLNCFATQRYTWELGGAAS